MSGFPMVPRFTNNTDDDDNSIHLKHNIGKANPLITYKRRNNHNNEVFSYNNNNHNSDVSIDEKIAKIILNSKTSIRENGNDIMRYFLMGNIIKKNNNNKKTKSLTMMMKRIG